MHNRLFHRIENFEKDQIFWCKDCDSRQVSSSDKSTGVFFGIFGTKVF